MVRSWTQSQRQALSEVARVKVEADVRHLVDGGSAERLAEYHLSYEGEPGRGNMERRISDFRLSGDRIDPGQAEQLLRRLRSSFHPEFAPLLDGFVFPAQIMGRFRPAAPLSRMEFEGRPYIRVELLPGQGPPPDRPPGGIGNGPPDGRRPPPGGRQGPPRPPDRPPERAVALFDADSGRLVLIQVTLSFPGNREGIVETEFIRINGVDLPSRIRIEGAFSIPRRLRSVTVRLDHETRFKDYELVAGN